MKGPPENPIIPNTSPFLVIPVSPGRTNISLRFGVLNDSAPQYAIADDEALTAELVHLELFIQESSGDAEHWVAATQQASPVGKVNWNVDSPWRSEPGPNPKILRFPFPRSILPGQSDRAAEIKLDLGGDFFNPLIVATTIRGKRVPNVHHLFKLVIVRSSGAIEPFIATNSIAAIKLLVLPGK